VSAVFSSFAALILVASFLASSALLNAQVANRPTHHGRHRSALPMVSGVDGSQTGIADFFGNFTAISVPTGALALGRQPNCSLGLATGTYDINSAGLTYTQTDITPHYELLLHSEAQLTTTPDVFASGCIMQPPAGFGSQPGVFVGSTTTGIKVFAGLGLIYPSLTNGVYILTGTTSFTLSSFQDSSAGNLTAADLNKDGNGDLVILDGASATTSRVTVMLGNSDGTFKNAVMYPIAGNYSVAAVIDDVNGDGNLDIIAVSGDQQISVLLGNGDGTFQAAQSFAAPTLPGYSSAASTPIVNLITADLRGVGKKDIICSNGLVLLGNGNGTFTSVATPAFPYFDDPLYSGGPSLASGDVNHDGKIDLVVNNSSTISIWIGKGDGTFTLGQSYATIPTDGIISVSDLDGDGNADIFVGLGDGEFYGGDEGAPNLAYGLMGNGNGTFQGAPQIAFGAYTGNNLADVTGSGTLDLITNTINTPYGYPDTTVAAFTVQLGTGKGSFNPVATTITAPASFVLNGTTVTGANTTTVDTFAVGDISGDGKADLVFADNGIYSAPVYFTAISNGDGTFQAPVPNVFPQIAPSANFDISNAVSGLQITSLKKGGNASLIFSFNEIAGGTGVNPYNLGIVVLPGNGNGTFQAPVITATYSSTSPPTSAFSPQIEAVADLNGDGNADLLVSIPGTVVTNFQLQNQLEVFLGNGDGTFKTPIPIASVPDLYGIPVIADLNKDGKLDLVFLGETAPGQAEIVIALGNGDGTFGTPSVLDLPDGDAIRSAGFAAGDFNGDGNLDLALFDSEAFSGIFYGNGNGTFTSVNIGTASAPNLIPQDLVNISVFGSAVAVNLTSSSAPDILAGNTVLLNVYGSAPTITSTAPTVTVTPSPSSITTAQSTMVTVAVSGGSGAATPTGSVTLSSGTYTSATTTLTSGGAVITVPAGSLATGADTLTATYTPDSTSSSIYKSATGTGSITVTAAPPPSFALTNSGNITASPGATTGNTSTISVTPSGGFTGAVALTCAITPAAASDPATCALSPASVTISGTTAQTSSLTLTTTAATTAAVNHPTPGKARWYAAGGATLAGILLFLMPARRRRWRTMLGMIVLFALLTVGLVSCGGGGGGGSGNKGGGGGTSNPGTTAGTYTVTVTGTSGSTAETTPVTFTVN
jgi:VCBS repeat protein